MLGIWTDHNRDAARGTLGWLWSWEARLI